MLKQLFNLCYIVLQVLVPLELALHSNDILGVPDLAIVHCFEVLLELVQLRAQLLALCLDLRKTLLTFSNRMDVKLSLSLCILSLVCGAQLSQVVCRKSVSIRQFTLFLRCYLTGWIKSCSASSTSTVRGVRCQSAC